MKLPKWTGVPLHALAGFGISALLSVLIPGWFEWRFAVVMFSAMLAYGVWREAVQHADDATRWNLHRWIEALAWGIGALLGGLL